MGKDDTMIDKYKEGKKEMMLVFNNKEPKWNETVQAYVLNFNGRVDQASVKNFQLIMGDENYIFMQFGKIGKNEFNMDVQWPLSLFQALQKHFEHLQDFPYYNQLYLSCMYFLFCKFYIKC